MREFHIENIRRKQIPSRKHVIQHAWEPKPNILDFYQFQTLRDGWEGENLQCHSRSCLSLGQRSMALMYILTAESKSEYLHSLHRCRGLQRRSREASWKLLDMHRSRHPDMGDGTSRSPSHCCQRGLTQQCILTVGSQSATCLNISWIVVMMSGKSYG